MSSFTVGMAILGGLVLAALVAWNAWSTRRQQPRQASSDPTLEDAREPQMDEAAGPAELPDQGGVLSSFLPERRPGLDALIDVIAPIEVDSPVSGDAALSALPATRRAGSKPFSVEGLNARTEQWEVPMSTQRYKAFQAGVQLANRTGALNEIEYSEFVVKAQAFADSVGGSAQVPEMLEEVARARELDQFASTHDAQLNFTLRARGAAWSPGFVVQHASRFGFVPGAVAGRLVLPPADGQPTPILSIHFDPLAALAEHPEQSAIRDLSIVLDVPHVAREERPFERMREVADGLAQSMDGVLTDDNRQPIPSEALDQIAADLQALYDTLAARDLAAGSPQARRLFS